jgi:hypothetical protein
VTRPTLPYGVEVSVVSRTAAGVDQYGNDVPATVQVDVPGCVVWPRTSVETDNVTQDTVITGVTVLFPPGTVLPKATDTVIVQGVEYRVTGDPFDWSSNPWTNSRAGTQVEMVKVTG